MPLPPQLLGVLRPVVKVEGSPALVAVEGVSAGGRGLLPTWIQVATADAIGTKIQSCRSQTEKSGGKDVLIHVSLAIGCTHPTA